MIKKLPLRFLALLFALSLMTGMTLGQDTINLRFTVWTGNEAHLAMLNGIAAAYQETNPNVTVTFVTIPFADYQTKLAIELSGSNPFDAGWMPESLAVPFLEAGTLLDLSSVTRDNPDYNFADLSEAAMSLYLRDDGVFGIPFSTSPELIYFNRDLFEAAGLETPDVLQENDAWTWDALRAAAKTIKDTTDVYGFQSHGQSIYNIHLWHNLAALTRAFGGDIWNAEGTDCLLDTAESRAAIQFYHDMVFVDGSTVPPGTEADFSAGSAAMTIGFLSQSARLGEVSFEWGIARLPEGPAGYVSVIGQSSIVAFQNSRNPEVAADFVAFITNQQNVETMAQFFPPIRASVLNSGAFANANPAVAPEALETSVVPSILNGSLLPTHVEFPKIDLAGRAAFDALWNPEGDVEAVTTAACEAIEAFMQ